MSLWLDRRCAMASGLCAAVLPAAAMALGENDDVTDPQTYSALALQLTARSLAHLPDRAAMREAIQQHIALVEKQVSASARFVITYGGDPVRLVVLPEYVFTSYPLGQSIPEFADAVGFAPDGPEYDALGGVAQRQGLYLAGNAYETDPHFPDFYFQTSFIVAPSGDVVLRYRRLLSMFAPSPHDVWEAYLDRYGLDGVFPVADTEIGRLAAIASEEILYPEIARVLAMRGAEVFAHCSSEIGSPLATAKDIAKQARAFENMAYVVSANTAGIADAGLPLASAEGGSRVIDYKGGIMAQSGDGETMTAFGKIDLGALRKARRTPAMINSLARQRPGLFAQTYAESASHFHQPDGMMQAGQPVIPPRDYFRRAQEEVIERLSKAGII